MAIQMEKEVERFLSNTSQVLHNVGSFRNKFETRMEQVMADTEQNIEQTLYGTRNQPRIHPIFTPELTELDENRFYIALSIAFFDHTTKGKRVSDKLNGTKETKIAETARALERGIESGNFAGGAKYEKKDNSILISQVPEKLLPDKKKIPPILGFLWNTLNTSVDVGTKRNHGWGMLDVKTRIAHEMTHAYNTKNSDPLKNSKTSAVDEGAAMAVTYAISGHMTEDDYTERGIDPQALEKTKKILAELVDRQKNKNHAVSKTREKSLEAIKILDQKRMPVQEAFKQL